MGQRALSLGLLALLFWAAGCYGSQVRGPKVARLKVIAEPEDARVYANGQYLGAARVLEKRPKELRPGVRYITVKAPGYFPHDIRVDLPPGTSTLEIELRPIPP